MDLLKKSKARSLARVQALDFFSLTDKHNLDKLNLGQKLFVGMNYATYNIS